MPQPNPAKPVLARPPVRVPAWRPAAHTMPQLPNGMSSQFQSFCAQAALFLLPLPAIKHPAISLTVADLFLVPAILLNLGHGMRLHAFQIPLLLALPLNLLSHMLDPDGTLTPIFQMVYMWGFLVPFGWCAFVNIPLRRIAFLLLLANGLSSAVAMGQIAGVVPTLPTQRVIELNSGLRAAGLVLQCNSLTMVLTPCFLLLPYVRQAWLRIFFLLLLLGGLASTVSKSAILAVPGLLLYFFWREPEKTKVLRTLAIVLVAGMLVLSRGANVLEVIHHLWETVEYRLTYVDESVGDRTYLARVALEHAGDCWFLGYGTDGTYTIMNSRASMGQTVHVFYLGLILVAGWPAFGLATLSFLIMFATLWRFREFNYAVFLGTHLMAISVVTILYVSFQYAPFVIAGAVIAQAQQAMTLQSQLGQRPPRRTAKSLVSSRVSRRAA